MTTSGVAGSPALHPERQGSLDRHSLALIELALAEDLGGGDVTTAACVRSTVRGSAVLVAREPCVLSGLVAAQEVFRQIDPDLRFEAWAGEGDRLDRGTIAARISGKAASLLQGERTALNFVRRLCGVATLTARYVAAVQAAAGTAHGATRQGSTSVRVVDTRKTTPGLRFLEKAAVRAGGGVNHRHHLGDGVLIKDNHLVAAGGITEAVRRARAAAHHLLRVEVEVEDLAGLEEAIAAGAEVVMLDNMSPREVARAVQVAAGRALLEASGGINLETIGEYAATGVDLISVGALTHGAVDTDLALDLELEQEPDSEWERTRTTNDDSRGTRGQEG